jgi:transposase
VHDLRQKRITGGFTKRGRRDLRRANVNAVNHAVDHPCWKAEFASLLPRFGRSKAIVGIVHKLLVAVWYVLTEEVAEKHADARSVACSLFAHA